MINFLTSELPTTVIVGGREYPINTDFRACLKTILAFEDNTLTRYEKAQILLANAYPEGIPTPIEAAASAALSFLDEPLSKNRQEDEDEDGAIIPVRIYSLAKDDALIYAAFQQTHGIDLHTAQMHYYRFISLFMDLGKDTTFIQLTYLRNRYYKGKATKEEKQIIRDLGSIFDVPQIDDRTIEEREAELEFMNKLNAGLARRKGEQNNEV